MSQEELKNQLRKVREAMLNVLHQPHPTLGIDLDGCCDESPFFSILTNLWLGDVIVITFRSDRGKAIADLSKHGIRYKDVVLVDSFDAKAEVINERGISFFIDDQPEMLKHISPSVGVMLFRNGGNFDFNEKKWMMSNETATLR